MKLFIAFVILAIGMIPLFNQGFKALLNEEVRDSYKPFKLLMYRIWLISIILASLNTIHPLFFYNWLCFLTFFIIVALLLNLFSLYLPEDL